MFLFFFLRGDFVLEDRVYIFFNSFNLVFFYGSFSGG